MIQKCRLSTATACRYGQTSPSTAQHVNRPVQTSSSSDYPHRNPPIRRGSLHPSLPTFTQLQAQQELFSSVDVFRRMLLGPHAVIRSRSINTMLRNAQTQNKTTRKNSHRGQDQTKRLQAEFQAATERGTPQDATINLLHAQFKSCRSCADVSRVMTVALRTREIANYLKFKSVQRTMCLMLTGLHDDRDVPGRKHAILQTLGLYLTRFRAANLYLNLDLIALALKVSAELAHPTALATWLQVLHQFLNTLELDTPPLLLLNTLQAMRRGIATVTSPDRPAMLRILLDLYNTSSEKPSHLGTLILYDDPQIYSEWIELLVECGATTNQLHHEWSKFKVKHSSTNNTALSSASDRDSIQDPFYISWSSTIHALVRSSPNHAWHLFAEHAASQPILALRTASLLLDNLQSISPMSDAARLQLDKTLAVPLQSHLLQLERDLGLMYFPPDHSSKPGYHKALQHGKYKFGRFLWLQGSLEGHNQVGDESLQGDGERREEHEDDDFYE